MTDRDATIAALERATQNALAVGMLAKVKGHGDVMSQCEADAALISAHIENLRQAQEALQVPRRGFIFYSAAEQMPEGAIRVWIIPASKP
jgi:hypothetical protein